MTAYPEERAESLVREARDAALAVLAWDDSAADASRFLAAALLSPGACQGAPIDCGAAWVCADAHFNRPSTGGARRLVSLSDLGAFYVARGVRVGLAEPPQVPAPDGETVLVLDKASGRTSRWPLLLDADLIGQYRRYLRVRGEPMMPGERSTVERPLRPRLFQRGAWTIRSSPIP